MTVTPLLTSVPHLIIPLFYTWITTNLPWEWEFDLQFDEKVVEYSNMPRKPITWVNWMGTPLEVSSGVTVQEFSEQYIHKVIHGEELADPAKLLFRDPKAFRAGELHKHYSKWCKIMGDNPSPQQATILRWIRDGVSIFEFFQSFSGSFKAVITNRIVPHRNILEIALPVNLLLTL